MITAKTLQLLDANNVNISPAVCVESLYYEKNIGGETYRMSVRDKMIIAGNIRTSESITTEIIDDRLFIPCYTINALDSGDLRVFELNSGSFDISESINQYISNTEALSKYTTTTQLRDLYIQSQNGAIVSTDLQGACNLKIGSKYSNNNNNEYITLQTESGGNYSIEFGSTAHIKVQDKNNLVNFSAVKDNYNLYFSDFDRYDVRVNYVNIDVKNEISLSANSLTLSIYDCAVDINEWNGLEIVSDSNISMTSSDSMTLNTSIMSKVSDASSVIIPAYKKTTINDKAVLSIKDVKLPNIYFYNQVNEGTTYELIDSLYNASNTDVSVYIRNIEYIEPIKSSNNTVTYERGFFNLYAKKDTSINESYGFKTISSGKVAASLICTLNSPTSTYNNIRFKTINGKSILTPPTKTTTSYGWVSIDGDTTTNINLATPDDIENNTSRVNLQPIGSTECYVLSTQYYGSYENHNITLYNQTNIKMTNSGYLFATRFYQSSDERLKTNISDVEFTDYIPQIKQFNYIDSSVKSYGYIAQEVEAYYPELVYETSDGYKRVDYNAAHSLSIAGLQKDNENMHKEINELRKENEELKAKFEKLEQMLKALI